MNSPKTNEKIEITQSSPLDSQNVKGTGSFIDQLQMEVSLHHTPDGRGFISFKEGGKKMNGLVHSITSRQKIKYIAKKLKKEFRNIHELKGILDELEEKAITEGTKSDLELRVVSKRGFTHINPCHADGKLVRVSSRKIEEVYSSPDDVFFAASPGMMALPQLGPAGDIERLKRFLNVKDERNWRLLLVVILSYLSGIGPFVCTRLIGEQGTAKSTASRVIRMLIDPTASPLQSLPRSERDFLIMAMNSYLLVFDNISEIPDWLSDALCRILTGGGLATRSLYSNDQLRIFFSRNPVLINSITESVRRSDLLDRSVTIFLRPISDIERLPESEFWSAFELEKSKIFSALLEKLSHALAILPLVPSIGLPRMADFAKFGIAMEEAMGWKKGTFLADYNYMKSLHDSAALDNFPCYGAIKKIAEEGWSDTASNLLTVINDLEDDYRLKNSRHWPKSPAKLSADLNRFAPNLRKEGIHIDCNCKTAGSNSSRYISIKKVNAGVPNGS